MTHWTFQPIFDSYLIAGLLIAILLLLWFIKPAISVANPKRQRVLRGLRLAVILLVALALLRPTWVWSETRSQSASVLLLWDQSR
ncbi:MAG: hypothetical protein AAF497_07925, partial [Planctomycetota bacterium]